MKKNTPLRLFLSLGLLLHGASSFAQLTLTGQIIPRMEYRHGYKSLADSSMDAALFTEQRTRIAFGYVNEKFRTGISIQDVRVWGSTSQANKTDGLTSIHEAWGEYLFNKKISAKLGRQELAYDDHRILGNSEWNPQARSHDVALFKYNDSTFSVHAGIAFNQDKEQFITNLYTVPNNYKAMQFIWANEQFKSVNASLLFLNNGVQNVKTDTAGIKNYNIKYTQTVGPRIEYKAGKLNAMVYFYYQTGEDTAEMANGDPKKISASDVSAEVGYVLFKGFMASAGIEILSGTSQIDTTAMKEEMKSFNPYYGTNHKFNGYMDYFYVGNHLRSVGLQDIYFKLKYKAEKYFVAADVHLFSAAADIRDKSKPGLTAMNKSLGTEIDLTLGYTLSKNATLQAGYSQMLGTDSMKALKAGNTNASSNWAYIMFKFSPDFLTPQK